MKRKTMAVLTAITMTAALIAGCNSAEGTERGKKGQDGEKTLFGKTDEIKNPAKLDSTPAAGRFSGIFHSRLSAVIVFLSYGILP